jgi:hypothetical protein
MLSERQEGVFVGFKRPRGAHPPGRCDGTSSRGSEGLVRVSEGPNPGPRGAARLFCPVLTGSVASAILVPDQDEPPAHASGSATIPRALSGRSGRSDPGGCTGCGQRVPVPAPTSLAHPEARRLRRRRSAPEAVADESQQRLRARRVRDWLGEGVHAARGLDDQALARSCFQSPLEPAAWLCPRLPQ